MRRPLNKEEVTSLSLKTEQQNLAWNSCDFWNCYNVDIFHLQSWTSFTCRVCCKDFQDSHFVHLKLPPVNLLPTTGHEARGVIMFEVARQDVTFMWMSVDYKALIQHYDDVIMTMLASQITSLTVVYSIVYSGVNLRKHQSSASLAFVWEIHRGPVNFPHKWPVTRKMFPFDDVIMNIKMLSYQYRKSHCGDKTVVR